MKTLDPEGVLAPRIVMADIDDAAVIADLHRRCFTAPGDEVWDAGAIRSILGNGGQALLARSGGGSNPPPDAFIIYRTIEKESEILSLGVVPALRGRGRGKDLLCAALEELRTQGVEKVFLEVATDNYPARRLYQNLGFRMIGRRPRYYRRPGRPPADALTLRYDLPA